MWLRRTNCIEMFKSCRETSGGARNQRMMALKYVKKLMALKNVILVEFRRFGNAKFGSRYCWTAVLNKDKVNKIKIKKKDLENFFMVLNGD